MSPFLVHFSWWIITQIHSGAFLPTLGSGQVSALAEGNKGASAKTSNQTHPSQRSLTQEHLPIPQGCQRQQVSPSVAYLSRSCHAMRGRSHKT